MTPCIGWLADPPCPVHGITHGCRWPDGHTGGRHECIFSLLILAVPRILRGPFLRRVAKMRRQSTGVQL